MEEGSQLREFAPEDCEAELELAAAARESEDEGRGKAFLTPEPSFFCRRVPKTRPSYAKPLKEVGSRAR